MKNLSLSTKVLLGVLLGTLTGLFFGEDVAWMGIIGDIFIGLLQMTVLPYIMFSLIVNIGRLSLDTGKKIIRYGLIFLFLLLSLGLVYLIILPFSFPSWSSGNFYSSEFVQPSVPFDFVKLYIPANPFESMSDNVVPAVVLFSIFIGLGVMKLPNKEALLQPLDVLTDGLNQVNKMIIKITPLGVFSIAAGVVSTLSWSDLSRLQGYLLVYLLAVILFTFLILPSLISIFTPYSAKTIFKITRSTLITIFATGKIIVVYPQLIENIKEIIRADENSNEENQDRVDIIMPLAYPFPNLGTFMIFIFVPFAAWFTGKSMELSDYPVFLSSTFLSSFVAPITGLPFSLDLLKIPKETFQLFVVSTVLTDRIRVVLGAFHLIALTLLTIAASGGFLQFKKRKIARSLIVIGISTLLSVIGLRYVLETSMKNIPTNLEIVNSFKLISPQQEFVLLDRSKRNPNPKWRGENTLSRIKRRKKLRVGYYEDARPFTFFNRDSVLVGYGIDLAHQLASDLEVKLEFVPINPGKLIEGMNKDHYDIVMSDIFLSSRYAEDIELSKPYLNVSLALLTKQDNKIFNSFETASKLDTFTISYIERKDIANEFLSYFPEGGAYPVPDIKSYFELDKIKEKVKDTVQLDSIRVDSIKIDAHLTSAERAASMTVINPEYKVVNPLPYHINNALVFPVAKDNVWKGYIDKWIDFREKDGTFDKIYDQWILGNPHQEKAKKWSILDNVIMPRFSKKDTISNDFVK
ncbi:cation:dicarboxylase symporter family transporter [Lutimonas saemankumensis]|uniref:cation:dicarboxylate symporter family transporter n=1 Tax=Lutimonas saemankumensis TaxID=483016 RepID=UPI001CD2CA34|nr:cation:dicarboxylase symporter family transporter [Lutimonas saemankumensis]MCA0932550.1 cation:dicarboxylase symporter family transporter [Lutimonas saemankumensis]